MVRQRVLQPPATPPQIQSPPTPGSNDTIQTLETVGTMPSPGLVTPGSTTPRRTTRTGLRRSLGPSSTSVWTLRKTRSMRTLPGIGPVNNNVHKLESNHSRRRSSIFKDAHQNSNQQSVLPPASRLATSASVSGLLPSTRSFTQNSLATLRSTTSYYNDSKEDSDSNSNGSLYKRKSNTPKSFADLVYIPQTSVSTALINPSISISRNRTVSGPNQAKREHTMSNRHPVNNDLFLASKGDHATETFADEPNTTASGHFTTFSKDTFPNHHQNIPSLALGSLDFTTSKRRRPSSEDDEMELYNDFIPYRNIKDLVVRKSPTHNGGSLLPTDITTSSFQPHNPYKRPRFEVTERKIKNIEDLTSSNQDSLKRHSGFFDASLISDSKTDELAGTPNNHKENMYIDLSGAVDNTSANGSYLTLDPGSPFAHSLDRSLTGSGNSLLSPSSISTRVPHTLTKPNNRATFSNSQSLGLGRRPKQEDQDIKKKREELLDYRKMEEEKRVQKERERIEKIERERKEREEKERREREERERIAREERERIAREERERVAREEKARKEREEKERKEKEEQERKERLERERKEKEEREKAQREREERERLEKEEQERKAKELDQEKAANSDVPSTSLESASGSLTEAKPLFSMPSSLSLSSGNKDEAKSTSDETNKPASSLFGNTTQSSDSTNSAFTLNKDGATDSTTSGTQPKTVRFNLNNTSTESNTSKPAGFTFNTSQSPSPALTPAATNSSKPSGFNFGNTSGSQSASTTDAKKPFSFSNTPASTSTDNSAKPIFNLSGNKTFGSNSPSPSPGPLSFNTNNNTNNSISTSTAFGAPKTAFGSSGFGASNSRSSSPFGNANSQNTNTGNTFGSSANTSNGFGASNSGPGFGNPAFGASNNTSGSPFGAANNNNGAFGSSSNLGTGFGNTNGSPAFGNSRGNSPFNASTGNMIQGTNNGNTGNNGNNNNTFRFSSTPSFNFGSNSSNNGSGFSFGNASKPMFSNSAPGTPGGFSFSNGNSNNNNNSGMNGGFGNSNNNANMNSNNGQISTPGGMFSFTPSNSGSSQPASGRKVVPLRRRMGR